MPTDPTAELRQAALELGADEPVALAIAAWLEGVAERMGAGGWVLPPERTHALKIARAVLRRSTAS
ncbi:hypothetical protein [Embleya scabrispora]|uniref:hypothetical protein n=1 Tax=Embleya scabrispora TaxID=159449 RepID=UPI001374E094|nr:hypothetical protein [Embleya scabrispora]